MCSVAVPPLVLRLKVDIGECISGITRLSDSRRSPNPYPSDILGDMSWDRSDLVGVNILLKGKVSLQRYESLSHGLLCSDLEELLVLFRLGTLLVELSGFESKLPRSLETCLLLEAIVGCSIILFYYFKMSPIVVFLKGSEGLPILFLVVEEELDMHRSFLALLQLSVDISGVGLLVPCFQVLLDVGGVRVVEGAEEAVVSL